MGSPFRKFRTLFLLVAVAIFCQRFVCALGSEPTANTAREMKLWKEIDLSDHAGMFVCVGDLDNDDRVDFFLYRQGPQTTPGCLVALDHNGKTLWQLGDAALTSHSPDGLWKEPALRGISLVYDLDGDGRSEVITELWKDDRPMLCLLDGATGKIEAERPSPLDLEVRGGKRSRCHPVARIALLNGKDAPPALVLKYGASGRVPSHAFALNSKLETLWHFEGEPTDAGHLPSAADLDDDGKDEILLGLVLLDEDGSLLWRQPAKNHADCTAVFRPQGSKAKAALMSVCNTGPAFCLGPAGKTIWEKTCKEVSHGQGIWPGNFLDTEPGDEVIILRSGHWGDFLTVRASDGESLAAFQHRRELKGYPDFPCVVDWLGGGVQSLWIPIDRALVDGRGQVVADLGSHEDYVQQKLQWGTTKSHVATQAFAVDLCGDERQELVLYQPYSGESILIFTQPDSDGAEKPYMPQESAYNIHSYF